MFIVIRQRVSGDLSPWFAFGSNYDLATSAFGVNLGTIREGSSADFILNYRSPTEITAENFMDHFFLEFATTFR